MPWKSRWQIPIPTQSIPTFLFGPQDKQLSDKHLLIDAEKPEYYLTEHTYREWSKRFATGLQTKGFQAGDRLLLYSGNCIFFPVVLMGTIMAGGIFTGANPSYVARELAYQLQDSGASIFITTQASLKTALEAAESISFPRSNIYVIDEGFSTLRGNAPKTIQGMQGLEHFSQIFASPSTASSFRWREYTVPQEMDATAVLNYSSGTTGVPKGVEITHLNYISNCMQTEYMSSLEPNYTELLESAQALSFLPMYHAYGQTFHCVSCAKKGVPVYIMRKFDFGDMLKYVGKYRISSLTLVPPIAVALTKRPEARKADLSSVIDAGCGAAPLGKESVEEFDRVVSKGRYRLKQGWGMTEITCSAMGWDPNVTDIVPGAVGELNPNIEGMIVDDNEKELGLNQRGELWVRGPNVMKGYWRKPEATRDTKTPDGWLKTGDIAYRDDRRLIYIVDRKKELIKVKGNQVAPAELEALLLDHPAVQDAAVVGVTIRGEELPRAYIVPQGGYSSVPPTEIAKWLAERVAPHKRLAGGVAMVDAIPKNPSGKILRKLLREKAKEEVGDRERESRL